MNQGKLEVAKQEMARVNTDILGISELRWTGIGEFNSGFGLVIFISDTLISRTVKLKIAKMVLAICYSCNRKQTSHRYSNSALAKGLYPVSSTSRLSSPSYKTSSLPPPPHPAWPSLFLNSAPHGSQPKSAHCPGSLVSSVTCPFH